MTDPPRGAIEVPINRSPENQLAKRWLQQARTPANPLELYVIQLAVWGMEEAKLQTSAPMSPSHPLPEDVESLTYRLLMMSGAAPAQQAMRFLLSNPNTSRQEERANLNSVLTEASSPQEAAARVLEIIHDLMAATSE